MGTEQRLDPIPQPGIAPAGAVQVRDPGGFVRLFGGFEEDLFDAIRVGKHGHSGLGFTHQCENRLRLSHGIRKKVLQPDSAPEMASRSQARAYVQWR